MAFALLYRTPMSRPGHVLSCLLAIAGLSACSDPATAPDAGDLGQGSETTAALVINEVSPKPASGADWLEIMNTSDVPRFTKLGK